MGGAAEMTVFTMLTQALMKNSVLCDRENRGKNTLTANLFHIHTVDHSIDK